MLELSLLFLLAVVVFLTRRWYENARRNPKSLQLLPGPKPLPLLGNYWDVPDTEQHPWLKVAQWKEVYGDMTYVQTLAGGRIYVNSWEVASDLLEKRSANYSDRHKQPMLNDIIGWKWALFTQPYGTEWRKQRKVFHQHFHGGEIAQYQPLQTIEIRKLLIHLLSSPESFLDHILHAGVSGMMRAICGVEVSKLDTTYDTLIDVTGYTMARAGMPGSFMVDFIPMLKYLPSWAPGAAFKRLGKDWKVYVDDLKLVPLKAGKSSLASGEAQQSVITSMLQRAQKSSDIAAEEEMATHVAAAALAAGSDTTVSAVQFSFLAMVLYPEIQAKVQAEIDSVVGRERLPEFTDLPLMPYVEATMLEILRHYPIFPIITPHLSLEDDEYRGYLIQKGTSVIVNTWSLLRDEKEYPEPSRFLPERFLDEAGQLNPSIRRSDAVAFGFGRRICPGKSMAMSSITLTLATVLSVFNINNALDKDGKPIVVKNEMSSGSSSHPLPFECSITPRYENAAEMIQRSLDIE